MECKFLGQALPMLTQFELIDTLWNVNVRTDRALKALLRINRYIMECKFLSIKQQLKTGAN